MNEDDFKKRLHIALDYDDTYTSDPGCFRAIIRCFQSMGHKITIVTMRSKEHDYEDEFDYLKHNYGVDTVFCDGQVKKEVTDKLGIPIDIWIDDHPEMVNYNSTYTVAQLTEWRKQKNA